LSGIEIGIIDRLEYFMAEIHIRKAVTGDSALILSFIRELAVFERAEDEVLATEEDIVASLFRKDSQAKAVICSIAGVSVGFAVYFFNYSTWLGRYGLYLEDLYISPEYRGRGAGKALLKYLAKLAVEKDCGRFEWRVLKWNKSAIDVYEAIGAKPQDEWLGYRLEGKDLETIAR
jgi:GNAT superfamily N-acetyltransferase